MEVEELLYIGHGQYTIGYTYMPEALDCLDAEYHLTAMEAFSFPITFDLM